MFKDKLKNINLNYLLVIILAILIILCLFLFIQNNKMNRIIKNIYNSEHNTRFVDRSMLGEYDKLAKIYQQKVNDLMRLEEEITRKNFFFYDDYEPYWNDRYHCDNYYMDNRHHNRIRAIEERQIQQKNQLGNQRENRRNRNFVYNTRTETNEKNFIVKIKIPRTFDEKNVKVDFKNRNLTIKIERQHDTKNKNEESYSYSSFFENFLVPETKATDKDVKMILNKANGNELTITVPIIK